MNLNKEELIIGFIVGISSWLVIGFWAIPVSLVTSFFWAYTGAGASKLYRRLGVPALISGVCSVVTHSWIPLISILPAFGVLSIGYGIPSTQPPDGGSWLGRLCWTYAGFDEKRAELYCRTIIYVLLALTFIPCLMSK